MPLLRIDRLIHQQPATLRFQRLTGIRNADQAVGMIVRLHGFIATHIKAGVDNGLDGTDVDRAMGRAGVAQAAVELGWLAFNPQGACVPMRTPAEPKPQPRTSRRGKAKPPTPPTPAPSSGPAQTLFDEPPAARPVVETALPRTADEPPKPRLQPAPAPVEAKARSPHAEAVDYFTSRWRQKYEVKYPFAAGKDGAAISLILKECVSIEKFRRVVDQYLACAAPFYVNDRHSISILRMKLSTFVVDGPPPEDTTPKQFKTAAQLEDERLTRLWSLVTPTAQAETNGALPCPRS